jgi:hypothetical protein
MSALDSGINGLKPSNLTRACRKMWGPDLPTDMVLGAETPMAPPEREDTRHHLASMLMRESLLDKQVQQSTECGFPHATRHPRH